MSLGKWITDKLLEQTKVKHVVAIYPGRFQPMGKHHVKAYNWLKKKFKDVYVTTSGKVALPNSPFSFDEKKKIINSLGITKLDKVSKPYSVTEMLSEYDPETTAVVFMIGEKDSSRLKNSKFFHKWNGNADLGYKEGAYIITTPHVSLNVPGYGEMSGTAIRKALGASDVEKADKLKLFKGIFGNTKSYDLVVNKLEKLSEVMEGFCSNLNIPSLLKESSIQGESAVDDGPRGYWGNQASWKKFGKNVEKYINPGMQVLNYLTGDEEFFDHKTEFKYDTPSLHHLFLNGIIVPEVEDETHFYAKFSCPFVQKRLFNYFSSELFDYLGPLIEPFEDLTDTLNDKELHIKALIRRYEAYLQKNREWLLKDAPN